MEVLVTSVQHGAALKPFKSLEVAVEIIYLHLQNDAKFLPFARKTAFPKERPFFLCGTAFFEIFQIINDFATATLPDQTATLPEQTATLPDQTATLPDQTATLQRRFFCTKRLFFTRTTKISAFWSNGGKKYHMEDVDINSTVRMFG